LTVSETVIVEPLGRRHDRAAFSCGLPELDRYLKRQAPPVKPWPCTPLVVDAANEHAKRFYEKFGFAPLTEAPMRLFLPLGRIARGDSKS